MPGDYEAYQRINREFAATIHTHLRPRDRLWVHDYHLLPLGRCLRERNVEHSIGFFLHVPVPSLQHLRQVPESIAAFEALECYDVVGVQTAADAARLSELSPGLTENVVVAPVGVDVEQLRALADTDTESILATVRHHGCRLLVGVDRLDYTKGLVERLRGFDALLRDYPSYRGAITLLQVVAPSRAGVAGYDCLLRQIQTVATRINRRWGTPTWRPLHLRKEALPREQAVALLRRADVGLVTPTCDGMNLVAKEFVAAQDPRDPGVLVLSRQAGAAETLMHARLVNADEPREIATAIDQALRSSRERRQSDHAYLLRSVRAQDAARWHRTLDLQLVSRDGGGISRALA